MRLTPEWVRRLELHDMSFGAGDALAQHALGISPVCERCGDRIEMDRLQTNTDEMLCWGCAIRSHHDAAVARAHRIDEAVATLKDRARVARRERLRVERGGVPRG